MSERRPDERDGSRLRRFDPGSVVSGLFFITVAGVFLAGALAGEPVAPLEVLGPALLIGLGVVGIIRILTRSRRRDLR